MHADVLPKFRAAWPFFKRRGRNMNHSSVWPKVILLFTLILCTTAERPQPPKVFPTESQPSTPCSAPEFHQFDFWLGDWDAFDADNPTTPVARAKVVSILDGCVVHEDYQDIKGSHGESFSIYDASRKVWHQTWVTNRGRLLTIEGSFQNGEMFMTGVDYPNGKERHIRGTGNQSPAGPAKSPRLPQTPPEPGPLGSTWCSALTSHSPPARFA
jgi:hypothetical protein